MEYKAQRGKLVKETANICDRDLTLYLQICLFHLNSKMPSAKTRVSANLTENVGISVNEKILRECHRLYTEEDKGSYINISFLKRVQVTPSMTMDKMGCDAVDQLNPMAQCQLAVRFVSPNVLKKNVIRVAS